MKESWREQMRQKMADYEQSAPELDWAAMERRLSEDENKTLIVPMWLRKAAAAAAVVAVMLAGYEMLYPPSVETNRSETPPTMAAEGRPLAAIDDKDEPDVETTTDVHEPSILPYRGKGARKMIAINSVKGKGPMGKEETPMGKEGHTMTEGEDMPVQPTEQSQEADTATSQRPDRRHETHFTATEPMREHKHDSRLTARVYLSNSLKGDELASLTRPFSDDDAAAPPYYSNDPTNGSTSPDDMQPSVPTPPAQDNSVTEDVSHKRPIRLGFSLRYRLDDRWSIESGLTYTMLSSDITTRKGGTTVKSEQRLSYIGIPLKIGCQLWDRRALSVYCSGGGMVETMTRGRRTSEGHEENVSQHTPQLSLNGAIGLEYKLTNQIGLYLEPTVEYHFDNGSSLPTIYRDEPFSIGCGVGFRVTMR